MKKLFFLILAVCMLSVTAGYAAEPCSAPDNSTAVQTPKAPDNATKQ